MVVTVAVEVTAPMVPVVVNGLRFKAKPRLGAEVVPGKQETQWNIAQRGGESKDTYDTVDWA